MASIDHDKLIEYFINEPREDEYVVTMVWDDLMVWRVVADDY